MSTSDDRPRDTQATTDPTGTGPTSPGPGSTGAATAGTGANVPDTGPGPAAADVDGELDDHRD